MGWMLGLCILMLLSLGCLAESLPAEAPFIVPTFEPTAAPSPEPTEAPTPAPTAEPMPEPTAAPAAEEKPEQTPEPTVIPKEPAEERKFLLPIDFSKGKTPKKSGYSGDGKTTWSYEDPTISVSIAKGRVKGKVGCDYWVATV